MPRRKSDPATRDTPEAQPRERRGRRQLLVYLPPDLIRALKIAGIELDLTGSEIVEEALVAWLRRRKRWPSRADSAP